MRSRAPSSPSCVVSGLLAGVLTAGCAPAGPAPAAAFIGQCIEVGGASLIFAPARGVPGPAFVIQPSRGASDYDAQVNAVDAEGRFGPDARGTVHLDASLRAGRLMTPDLRTAAGDTVRYQGSWHCGSIQSASPVIEPGGGPPTPR